MEDRIRLKKEKKEMRFTRMQEIVVHDYIGEC